MRVSVFGGSQPKADSPAYRQAYEIGRRLAQGGHTVLTGGYIGTMEAASRGASEAGGHVVGVTCEQIERWRSIRPNAWVQEERRKSTLMERLQALVEGCDAAIALPGGPGTLAELSLTWNLMVIGALPRRALVLVGPGWKAVIEQAYAAMGDCFPDDQRTLLQFAADADEAVALIEKQAP